jgi:hypothetical protein
MAATLPPFEAPARKLKWGRHRIDEFAWRISTYESNHPVELKYTDTHIILERAKCPPDELPFIIGDAIHNLRTSLDLLACDLVRLNGKSTKSVYFPFALDAKGLKEQIQQKNFSRAHPKAIDLLYRIGPHHEGNKQLRGLHDLDVMDKHKLIVPVFQGFRANNFRIDGPAGELALEFVRGSGDGFSVNANPGDVATYQSIQFFVLFDEAAPKVFHGVPIIDALKGLGETVGGIIESFRNLYIHGDEPPAAPVS